MSVELIGSSLTKRILEQKNRNVCCAVSNESDEHAMTMVEGYHRPSLAWIVGLEDGNFVCKEGKLWQFAVAVKKVELTQKEVGL